MSSLVTRRPVRDKTLKRLQPSLLPRRKTRRRAYDMSALEDQGVNVSNIVTRARSRPITNEEALAHFSNTPEERFKKLSRDKYVGVSNTSLRFAGGSIVCVGGRDIGTICLHLQMTRADYSRRLGGELVPLGPLTVQNIVINDTLEFPVDLEEVYQDNPLEATYEREVFPGLRYAGKHPSKKNKRVKINLFKENEERNNKFVIVGLSTPEDVLKARGEFIERVRSNSK